MLDILKQLTEVGMGGASLALFFRLGKIVAEHEIRLIEHDGRISKLEGRRAVHSTGKRRVGPRLSRGRMLFLSKGPSRPGRTGRGTGSGRRGR